MTTSPVAPLDGDLPIKQPGLDVIYVSGPMSKRPEFNYPAFRTVTVGLRAVGYTVYNPTERISECGTPLDTTGMDGTERLPKDVFDLRKAFAEYASFITGEADAIAVLPGWQNSPGAVGEVMLGRAFGLPVIDAITGEFVDYEVAVTVPEADALDESIARHPGNGTETPTQTLARVQRPALHAVIPTSPTPAPAVTAETPNASGEIRVVSATGGAKGSKEAQFSLIPSGPLWELAVLFGRGNIKYPPEFGEIANWKRGYNWSLSYDALKRHLDLWWSRQEDYDAEMGVKHVINVAWHALVLAWFIENRPNFDDRPPAIDNDGNDLSYVGALPLPQGLADLQAERARKAAEAAAAEAAGTPDTESSPEDRIETAVVETSENGDTR